MNAQPKVSVIVPVYNVERFLPGCLDSLINQTLRDIEIICVNDGSTDNSAEILKKYADKDKRIKVINQKNSGIDKARNVGIEKSTGKYIGFVDSDDWLDLDFYEKLYSIAEQKKADLVRACTLQHFSDKVEPFQTNNILIKKKNEILNINDHNIVVWDAIYKAGVIKENKVFFDKNKHEDVLWTTQITFYAQKAYSCPDTFYHYRRTEKDTQGSHIDSIAEINSKTIAFIHSVSYPSRKDYIGAISRCFWRYTYYFDENYTNPKFSREGRINFLKLWAKDWIELKEKEEIYTLYPPTVLSKEDWFTLSEEELFKKLSEAYFRPFSKRKESNKIKFGWEKSPKKDTFRVFGIPVCCIKKSPQKRKIYVLGVRVKLSRAKYQEKDPSILSVCVLEEGGLGDCLMCLPFIKAIYDEAPCPIKIDLCGRSGELFKHLPYLNNADKRPEDFSQYDLVLYLERYARVVFSRTEKVIRLYPKLGTLLQKSEEIKALFGNYTNLHLFNEYALIKGCTRHRQMDIFHIFDFDVQKPYYPIQQNEEEVLRRFDLQHKKYITLCRGTDAAYNTLHPKLWPLEHYNKLISLLKKRYPQIRLIQVGRSETYGLMTGVDMNLVAKTTLDEIAVLLKHALLHIDGEGGLAHLNHAVGGVSCILFGPTNPQVFGYPENINLRSNACPIPCDFITLDWVRKCIKDEDHPAICMRKLTPEIVFEAIQNKLEMPAD